MFGDVYYRPEDICLMITETNTANYVTLGYDEGDGSKTKGK
jgi:hypothetical protein